MKFNYVVGNPPYQYPKTVVTSKKLYIDITNLCIDLLEKNGKLIFITPRAILDDGTFNKVFKKIQKHIECVNFDADKYFKIRQNVISWIYSNNEVNKIKIIENNKTRYVNKISLVCKNDEILTNSILNKVSYKENGRKKCEIFNTDKKYGIENKLLENNKLNEDYLEVYCNTKNQRIKYTHKDNIIKKELQIIIPYIGGWEEGCQVTDRITNKFFYVNKKPLNKNILENMKIYFETKLITYCVIKFKEIKSSAHYNFLSRLPEIDLSKPWTDEELYKEFNLTDDEIKEVEKWYKEWKK